MYSLYHIPILVSSEFYNTSSVKNVDAPGWRLYNDHCSNMLCQNFVVAFWINESLNSQFTPYGAYIHR
jgi:hypothetical protein